MKCWCDAFFPDTEVLGCMVCVLLGDHTHSFLFIHIWSLHINGTSAWCCNGKVTIKVKTTVSKTSWYTYIYICAIPGSLSSMHLDILVGSLLAAQEVKSLNLCCRFSLVLLCLIHWSLHLTHSLGSLMDWLMWVFHVLSFLVITPSLWLKFSYWYTFSPKLF